MEFLVQVGSPQINDADSQQTLVAMYRRLETFGHSAPFFQTNGSNRVRILVAALSEADKAAMRNQITNSAVLEFRLVHSDNDELLKHGEVPPGYELLKGKRRMPDGTEQFEEFIVKKGPIGGLTGRAITNATVTQDNLGLWTILFQLSPEGTRSFAEVTRSNIGRRLAMVLNGRVLSAPVIRSPIEGGSAQITGDFGEREAVEIASLLESSLSAPTTILEERSF